MLRPMLIASLHTMLPAPASAGAAPEWVHVVPAGEFRGVDGRGPYRLRDAAAVATASMAPGRLPIDENHATDHALRAGGAAPARGWIVEMQARADGVWGRVEWTDAGAAMVAGREYRGLSPVFAHTEKGGEVLHVLRAGLTNAPNLGDLTALHTRQETLVDITKLRAALGLADDADEAAIIAAATASRTAAAAHTQALGSIAKAAGLAEGAAPDAIVVALQTRAAAGDPNALAGQVVALQTQIATLQADTRREKAVSAVDGAIKAGKPIAALREHFIARHVQDPAAVEKELGLLPNINAGGIVSPPKEGAPAHLDAVEQQVVQLMGVDPDAYRRARAKQGIMVGGA